MAHSQRLAYETKLREQFAHLIASLGDAMSPKISIESLAASQFQNVGNISGSNCETVSNIEYAVVKWDCVVLNGGVVQTIRDCCRSIPKAVLGRPRLLGGVAAAPGADTGASRRGSFEVLPPRNASADPDNERTQAHNASRALSSRLSVHKPVWQ